MPRAHHNPTARKLAASIKRPSTGTWTWDGYTPLSLRPDEVRTERLWRRYFGSAAGSDEAGRLLAELRREN